MNNCGRALPSPDSYNSSRRHSLYSLRAVRRDHSRARVATPPLPKKQGLFGDPEDGRQRDARVPFSKGSLGERDGEEELWDVGHACRLLAMTARGKGANLCFILLYDIVFFGGDIAGIGRICYTIIINDTIT